MYIHAYVHVHASLCLVDMFKMCVLSLFHAEQMGSFHPSFNVQLFPIVTLEAELGLDNGSRKRQGVRPGQGCQRSANSRSWWFPAMSNMSSPATCTLKDVSKEKDTFEASNVARLTWATAMIDTSSGYIRYIYIYIYIYI